jgi:hypothetical protein
MTLNVRDSEHLVDLVGKISVGNQTDEGTCRLAVITTLIASTTLYVTYEGEIDDNGVGLETTVNTPWLSSYTPAILDRVALMMIHGVWTIIGSVSGVFGSALVADWNDAVVPGSYVATNLAANAPVPVYVSGQVSSPDGSTIIQEVFEYARGMIGTTYKRIMLIGIWSPWMATKGQPTILLASPPKASTNGQWVEHTLPAINYQGSLLPNAATPAGFTLPLDGWYSFNVVILWPAGNGGGRRIVGIGPAGAGAAGATVGQYDNRAGNANAQSISAFLGPYFLAAGDYSVFTYQDSGITYTPTSITCSARPGVDI